MFNLFYIQAKQRIRELEAEKLVEKVNCIKIILIFLTFDLSGNLMWLGSSVKVEISLSRNMRAKIYHILDIGKNGDTVTVLKHVCAQIQIFHACSACALVRIKFS